MSRRLLFLAVALALAVPSLAGCLDGGDGDEQRDDDGSSGGGSDGGAGGSQGGQEDTTSPPERQPRPPPLPSPFLLQGAGCQQVALLVPVDQAQAEQALPEGFAPLPYGQAAGLPESPVGQAAVTATTFACERGGVVGSGQAGEPLAVHLLAIPVEVPSEFASSSPMADLFLLAAVTDDPGLSQAWVDRDWTAGQGEITLTLTSTPTGHGLFQATGQGAGLATQAEGATAGANTTVTPGFLRLWHEPNDRIEYLHLAITTSHPSVNATGTVRSDDPGSQTATFVGQGSAGQGSLSGPYDLLATPVVARR